MLPENGLLLARDQFRCNLTTDRSLKYLFKTFIIMIDCNQKSNDKINYIYPSQLFIDQ